MENKNTSLLGFLKVLVSIFLSVLPTFVLAQVSQRGFVKEYNEKDEKTPLSNVEIVVDKAGTTVSGKDGRFILQFQTLKAGDQVYLKRLGKKGYELFNTDAVKQWNISKEDKPFTIVMCRTDIFKRICDNYAKTSYASYARQHKADSVKLAEERVNGKLKESEYKEKLAQLQQRYEQDLKNINKYVERFARIDLSELSDKEKQITNLIGIGEIDKANELYEEMQIEKKIAEKIKNIKAVEEAEKAFEQQKIKEKAEKDSLFNIFMRSIDALKLAGGVENFMKIDKKFRDVIDMDSTNINLLLEYAYFSLYHGEDLNAEIYFKKVESLFDNNKNDDLISVYFALSEINIKKTDYRIAKEYLSKALLINKDIHNPESKVFIIRSMTGLSVLAKICDKQGDIDKAVNCYTEIDSMLRKLSEKDSVEYLREKKIIMMNEAKFFNDHGYHDTSDSIYEDLIPLINNEEVIDTMEHNRLLMVTELNYAKSLIERKNTYRAEEMLKKWIPFLETNAVIKPMEFSEFLISFNISLSEIYHMNGRYEEYYNLIKNIQNYIINIVDLYPYRHLPYLIYLQLAASHRFCQQRDYNNAIGILKCARQNIEIGLKDYPSMYNAYWEYGIKADVNTGIIYKNMGDYSTAESYWCSAIAKEDSLNLEEGKFSTVILDAYDNLCSLYFIQGKYELAKEYIIKYLKLVSGIDNNYILYRKAITYHLESLEDIFLQRRELVKALECVNILINLSAQINDSTREAMYHLSASQIYLDLKKKKDSKREWKEAEKCDSEYVAKHGQILSKKIFGK